MPASNDPDPPRRDRVPDGPGSPSRDHAGAPGPGNRTYRDPVVLIAAAVAVLVLVLAFVLL